MTAITIRKVSFTLADDNPAGVWGFDNQRGEGVKVAGLWYFDGTRAAATELVESRGFHAITGPPCVAVNIAAS